MFNVANVERSPLEYLKITYAHSVSCLRVARDWLVFSTSNNCSWDEPHRLRYRHCANLTFPITVSHIYLWFGSQVANCGFLADRKRKSEPSRPPGGQRTGNWSPSWRVGDPCRRTALVSRRRCGWRVGYHGRCL